MVSAKDNNASLYSHDLGEENDYVPEVLDALETNITDNKDDDEL